jgi:hypothetical protein
MSLSLYGSNVSSNILPLGRKSHLDVQGFEMGNRCQHYRH